MIWSSLLVYVFFILIINFCFSKSQRHGIYAKLIYIFTSLILVFLLLFRGNVGVDWQEGYVRYYEMSSTLLQLFKEGWYLGLNVEPGFQSYLSLLKTFNFHENWIPTVLLIFILWLLYLNCVKYKIQFIVVIALFILSTYLHYYGQIRMAVVYSLGILILSRFTYEKNNVSNKLIIFSILIHYVSVFYYIITYGLKILKPHKQIMQLPTFSKKIKTISIGVLLIIIAFLFGDQLFNSIDLLPRIIGFDFFIIDKYISYSSRFAFLETQISYKGTILLALLGFYFTLFYKTKSIFLASINKRITFFFFISVFIFLIFNQIPVLSHRLTSMLLIPSTILLGNIYFERTKNLTLFFLLFVYQIIKYFNLINEIGDYKLIV